MTLQSRLVMAVVRCFIYLRHPRLIKRYVSRMGYFPDPALPRRSTEKYLWRKLFDHDPRIVRLTDKLAAKEYLRDKFPDVAVAPVLWQGDNAADIPDEVLQRDCVIKTNHGSGMLWFVRDGNIDRAAMEKQFSKWMQLRYGKRHHEWAYGQIKPKLFVEEMLLSGEDRVNRDYKMYMCGDRLVYCYVCFDSLSENESYGLLDGDGSSIENNLGQPIDEYKHMQRPQNWEALLDTAKRLSSDFDHVRCDLHDIDGQIWFSEFTFYPMAGYEELDWFDEPKRCDDKWDIMKSWFLQSTHRGWRDRYARALQEALNDGPNCNSHSDYAQH